jgi:hypothetical protein
MITWGVISMAMMFAQGAFSFSALRFLLGAAEAGFLPLPTRRPHWSRAQSSEQA